MFFKQGRVLFNNHWQFLLKPSATAFDVVQKEKGWADVEVPHDWLIGDTLDLYRSGEGWYRKTFHFDSDDLTRSIELYFDGVYMNSTVYINNHLVKEWKNGYTPFYVEISDFVKEGENTVHVSVLYESPNSRWYSGAGIGRNVWLIKQSKIHFASDGVYIHADVSGLVEVKASVEEVHEKGCKHSMILGIFDNIFVGNYDSYDCYYCSHTIVDGVKSFESVSIKEPILWSPETPYLYTMKSELKDVKSGEVVDCVYNKFGFRRVDFSPKKGFILNGEPIKLHGVCQHHDLGALGAVVNVNAIRRQLVLLRGMGVNAIRTAHNPPATEFLELCDEMGFLVIDEFSDMWELSKTEYDYARFFPEWYKKDVEAWIKRDRNHPCVIMWSIGNEIYDTFVSERGLDVAKNLCAEIKKYVPFNNAEITIGSNFMMGENARNVSDYLNHGGYNYGEQFYDEHREQFPEWFMYGSETTSAVRSRGIYHFPVDVPLLTHDDCQCSDLGNSVVAWGKSNENAWIFDRDRPWCGGEFIWTGFDYIGEPTPYTTKNSYFGAIDTAGLPKASYYFYKSIWNENSEPFVKIFPYWDWNKGQIIDVTVYSNVSEIELFLNGESLGQQTICFENGNVLHGAWKVKYTKGELIAKAYDEKGNVIAVDRAASFGEAVALHTDFEYYGDLCFVTVSAIDKDGEFVANAGNRVNVTVSGGARLIGLDNGDSTDYDSYKGDNRRLFSGKLVAIVQGIAGCDTSDTFDTPIKEFVKAEIVADKIPVRKIELTASRQNLNQDNPRAELTAIVLPENADCPEIEWKCVTNTGVPSNIAQVVTDGDCTRATVNAKGDGNFRIRAYTSRLCPLSLRDIPKVISELEMSVSGMGAIPRNIDSFAVFTAASCDRVYGDGYEVVGDNVSKIGNNVVLEFNEMDFGEKGVTRLTIRGSTMNDVNPIRLNYGNQERLVEFKNSYCLSEQAFSFEKLTGQGNLSFTFLPGSSFDFCWFKFNADS